SANDSSSSTTRMRAVSAGVGSEVDGVRGIRELPELAGEEEPDLLADIDRVIAHPLELPGDQDHPEPPVERIRIPGERRDLLVHAEVQAVNRIIHRRQAKAQVEVARPERLHG